MVYFYERNTINKTRETSIAKGLNHIFSRIIIIINEY